MKAIYIGLLLSVLVLLSGCIFVSNPAKVAEKVSNVNVSNAANNNFTVSNTSDEPATLSFKEILDKKQALKCITDYTYMGIGGKEVVIVLPDGSYSKDFLVKNPEGTMENIVIYLKDKNVAYIYNSVNNNVSVQQKYDFKKGELLKKCMPEAVYIINGIFDEIAIDEESRFTCEPYVGTIEIPKADYDDVFSNLYNENCNEQTTRDDVIGK